MTESMKTTFSMKKWFPANDPIARNMARLCILREDLYLEYRGAGIESLDGLDDNGAFWRRMYFLRNSLRSLWEAHNSFSSLNHEKAFRKLMNTEDPALFERYQDLVRHFDKHYKQLTTLRHSLGGHVSREAMKKVLERIEEQEDSVGEFEDSRQGVLNTHYGFAEDLCAGIMLLEAPDGGLGAEAQRYLIAVVQLHQEALAIIQLLFRVYAAVKQRDD